MIRAEYQRAYHQANKEKLAEKKREEKAELQALRPNLNRKLRPCLRCDREFMSQGPHHRICPRCKGQYQPTAKTKSRGTE